ncbi:MAG: FkbM family methyltransferase [Solirubrobacteraceae bacterium]
MSDRPSLARLMRPQKISSALRRRWFERRLGVLAVSGRGDPVSLGSAYGGWIVPAALIEPGWRCYCVGAGADISFDLELIERFDVEVQSVEPDESYVAAALSTAAGEPRFCAVRAAITLEDGPLRMQRTHIPGSRSLSAAKLYDTNETIELPGRTLSSLTRELGHPCVDLLKIDIEGAEYDVLAQIDLDTLGVKVLATQLHHNGGVRAARGLIAQLESRGFELIAQRPVVKLTFARRQLLDGA